jgi:4-amino-4-deoxy-L-arabinose transferase-like glycosyltransferase
MSARDGLRASSSGAAPARLASAAVPARPASAAAPARPASAAAPARPATRTPFSPPAPAGGRVSLASRVGVSRWSGYAWGAIGATAAFIALTCWWLTQDRSIPIYDAGDHLATVFNFHNMIQSGDLLGPFNHESPYPPFVFLVGALASFIGGINVAAPIVGENLVFVSLLTLGCYQTGRLLFGPRAGLLAAIFVLGSDLLITQFHVFMLDAPEAALVAVSIWLILACDDFSRVRAAGVAGLVVGIGLITKVQYPSFVVGIVLIALLRGGWRNWRGLLAFAVVALVVGVPWYIDHYSEFSTFVRISTENPLLVPGDAPPTFSFANFTWYFWNILTSQLLAPLFILLLGGTIWMIVTLVRHRREALRAKLSEGSPLGARLEFFAGAFVAWLFITLTPDHDIRYGIPLLPYLAVIATGWIVYLPRAARWAATALVVLGVIANTLGLTFGVGAPVQVALVHPLPGGEENPDEIVFYTNAGFLVSGPSRDGDVPGLLTALQRAGVTTVAWGGEQSRNPDFSAEGLLPLTTISKLTPAITRTPEFARSTEVATLIHTPVSPRNPPPCTRLSDGTGVWVVRFEPSAGKLEFYCPSRRPQYYATAE